MDLTLLGIIVTGGIATFSALGVLHRNLTRKIDLLEIELYKKASFGDVRRTIEDKMSPIKVEYHSLTRRFDELKQENDKMSDKLDELIVICTNLSHKN